MDAIILVGGQGLRLRPLTATRHKSLVPVGNRPAISFLFDWLHRSGFERVVLALGQNNDDLADAFSEGRALGFRLIHVFEKQRLESGGAIRNAVRAASIRERFVVLNGDIFVDFDFQQAVAAHESAGAELTLALSEVDDPSQFGVAVVDAGGLVTGFVEKPPAGEAPSNLVNAGVWIFERKLVDDIPPGAVRVEETLFPSLVAQRRRVLGYTFDGPWVDVGNPRRYLELNLLLADREGEPILGAGVDISAGTEVQRSVIGEGTRIGERASLVDSVTWERCRIERDARIRASVLADGVTVGEGATLDGAVVGSGARIAPGAVAGPGTVIEPGAGYDAEHGR